MSNEIKFQALDVIPYVLIRQEGGKVWQTTTSSLVTWADGSYANYGIAMTNRGGGYYEANMPLSTPGLYAVQVRDKGGSSFAIDDDILSDGVLAWNGTSLISLKTIDSAVEITASSSDSFAVTQSTVDTTGNVIGAIRDSVSLTVIPGASVNIYAFADEALNTPLYSGLSDNAGNFRVLAKYGSKYRLKAVKTGNTFEEFVIAIGG